MAHQLTCFHDGEFGDEPFIATEVTDADEFTPVRFSGSSAARAYSRAKHGFASALGIDASWLENFPTTPVSVTSTLSA